MADEESSDLRGMTVRFWIGAALTAPVFLLAMARLIPAIGRQPWVDSPVVLWVQLANVKDDSMAEYIHVNNADANLDRCGDRSGRARGRPWRGDVMTAVNPVSGAPAHEEAR